VRQKMANTITEQHNKELKELYEKVFENIKNDCDEYNKDKDEAYRTASPFFLKSHEKYENSEIKMMIFGKETNGQWHKEPCKTVEEIMKEYISVFAHHLIYNSRPSHFWKGTKEIINLMKEKNAGTIGNIWNELVKMGYYGKTRNFPKKFYNEIVKPRLNGLIAKEIEILKPDYIIFLTGNDYDWILDDVFGRPKTEKIEGFSKEELCEIILPNVKKSFRTYHPRYLLHWRPKSKKDMKEKIFTKIIDEIIQNV